MGPPLPFLLALHFQGACDLPEFRTNLAWISSCLRPDVLRFGERERVCGKITKYTEKPERQGVR